MVEGTRLPWSSLLCCFVGALKGRAQRGTGDSFGEASGCYSVLLQSLPPAFVKAGCSNVYFLGQMPRAAEGLAEFEASRPSCLPSGMMGHGSLHVTPRLAPCDYDSQSFTRILI